jgi:hypothetical protein
LASWIHSYDFFYFAVLFRILYFTSVIEKKSFQKIYFDLTKFTDIILDDQETFFVIWKQYKHCPRGGVVWSSGIVSASHQGDWSHWV